MRPSSRLLRAWRLLRHYWWKLWFEPLGEYTPGLEHLSAKERYETERWADDAW